MSKPQPWYVVERAEMLAFVHLTRRADLLVTRQALDSGLSFLVDVVREDRAAKRTFGVQVRGRVSRPSEHEIDRFVSAAVKSQARLREYTFPVCSFLFVMQNDEGFYTWIMEPTVTVDGKPKLESRRNGSARKLDAVALDEIVNCVNRWYDALVTSLTV